MRTKSKTLFLNSKTRNITFGIRKTKKYLKDKFFDVRYKAKNFIVSFMEERFNFSEWKGPFRLWLIDVFFTTLLVSISFLCFGLDKPFRFGLAVVLMTEFGLNLISDIKDKIQSK